MADNFQDDLIKYADNFALLKHDYDKGSIGWLPQMTKEPCTILESDFGTSGEDRELLGLLLAHTQLMEQAIHNRNFAVVEWLILNFSPLRKMVEKVFPIAIAAGKLSLAKLIQEKYGNENFIDYVNAFEQALLAKKIYSAHWLAKFAENDLRWEDLEKYKRELQDRHEEAVISWLERRFIWLKKIPGSQIRTPPRSATKKPDCKNVSTLMGDDIVDLDNSEIIQTPDGYCFTAEELVNTFQFSRQPVNPYTKIPFWRNRDEFNKFIGHPLFTPENRNSITSIFFTPFDSKIISLVLRYPQIFDLIGRAGIEIITQAPSSGSASLLSQLYSKISVLSHDIREQFNELKTPDGKINLRELMALNKAFPIPSYSKQILGIYLYVWFHIPELTRPEIVEPLHQTSLKEAIVLAHKNGRRYLIFLFKYDEHAMWTVYGDFLQINVGELQLYPAADFNNITKMLREDVTRFVVSYINDYLFLLIAGFL